MAAIATLVILRFVLGLHFFTEGATKIQDRKPFSGAFFANAKGLFAPVFRAMVWDTDGLFRLCYAEDSKGRPAIEIETTISRWDQYREQVARHYGFEDKQRIRAQKLMDRRVQQLRAFVKDYRLDLLEYFEGVRRRRAHLVSAEHKQVASLRGQSQKWANDLRGQRAPLLALSDALWEGVESDMNSVANADQRARGPHRVTRPGRGWLDSETIDAVIPCFDMTIGLLLLVGLFTRAAAALGGLFLLSVVCSQFPGATGAIPTWPYLIEMLCMFLLATTAAGRFAGLDALTGRLFSWFRPTTKAGSQS